MYRWCAILVLMFSGAVAGDDQFYVMPFDLDPPNIIDGDLQEWNDVPNPLVMKGEQYATYGRDLWTDEKDLSATFHLAWRHSGICLGVKVIDDTFRQPYSGMTIYRGDHVNLMLDFVPSKKIDKRSMDEGQYHIAISPGNLDPDPAKRTPPEIKFYGNAPPKLTDGCIIAAKRTQDGYDIEAYIPFTVLGNRTITQKEDVNFTVFVSDADGAQAKQETLITPITKKWFYGRGMLWPMVFGDGEGRGKLQPRSLKISEDFGIPAVSEYELKFDLDTITEGKVPHLFFKGRIDWKKVGGFVTNALSLEVNDQQVKVNRLTNRPADVVMMSGNHVKTVSNEGVMILWYAPAYDSVEQDVYYRLIDGIQACEYEFRLDGLLKPGTNRIKFINHGEKNNESDRRALIADVALRFRTPLPPKTYKPPPTGPIPVREPKVRTGKAYSDLRQHRSNVTLNINGKPFTVASRFTSPDGQWHTGSTKFYTHSRKIIEHDQWIEVRDTFTNLTNQHVPIIQEHAIQLPENGRKVWLNGIWVPSGKGRKVNPENPSAYASTGEQGVGMIALNDAFRVHNVTLATNDQVQITDPSFILAKGKTYTSELAIVPSTDGDFWTFTNAGRRILDVNFKLDLCFTFTFYKEPIYQWTDQRLIDFVRYKSSNFVVQSNKLIRYLGSEYGYSTAFASGDVTPYIDMQKRLRKLMPPGVKTGVYYHCFLDNYRENVTRFADDAVLDASGKQVNYGGRNPHMNIFLPALGSDFAAETGKNIDIILDKIGADGIFWDEHQRCRVNYSYNPKHWDECSGDIDPEKFTIDRLKGSLALVSMPWRKQKVKYIRSRGPLITNGAPYTRTMSDLKYIAFTETGNISYCRYMLLHSPIGLGDHRTVRTERDAYHAMHRQLDNGCLHAWYDHRVIPLYPTLTEHMFPFTPIELHEGWVVGQERIITNRSGYFGWGDQSDFVVYVYDRDGKAVKDFKSPKIQKDGKSYAELRLPEGYSAAIVRQ